MRAQSLVYCALLHSSIAAPFNHRLGGWPREVAPSSSYPPGPILPAYNAESYLLPGEHPGEEPLVRYRCPNSNSIIWRCVPAREYYRPVIAEGQTIEMSAFRLISLSRSRVDAGSTTINFYRAYPIFVPGLGTLGRFMITWAQTRPSEVHIEAVIERPLLLQVWRHERRTELLSLSMIWGLYSTEFRDPVIRRERNPLPIAPIARTISHTPGAESLVNSVASANRRQNDFGEFLYTRTPDHDMYGPAAQRENYYSVDVLLSSPRRTTMGTPANMPFNTFILFRIVASEERLEYLNNGHIDSRVRYSQGPAPPRV